MSFLGFFLVFIHFTDAFTAHILAAEGNQIPEGTAEHAGRFKLLQNDPVVFHVDFQFVPFGNIQGTAQLNRQDNSAQFIHFPDNSGRLHKSFAPFLLEENILISIST